MLRRHLDDGPADRSAPPKSSQLEALLDLLRESLRRVLAQEHYDAADENELRVSLQAVCERARVEGIRAEQLLVVLKESWRELSERAEIPRYAADETLARVVRACINEYYLDEKRPASNERYVGYDAQMNP